MKLGPGDAVAFDPLHRNLIVLLEEKDGVRLVRMPASGGSREPIPIHSDLRLTAFLGSNAVRKDGQIAVSVALHDGSWRRRAGPGILKNEIVTGAFLMRSSIWRFRPQPLQDK